MEVDVATEVAEVVNFLKGLKLQRECLFCHSKQQ